MLDPVLAEFRREFQEARRFIELIKKYQNLKTTKNQVRFRAACKARDYDNAKRLFQAAREAGV